MAADTPTHTRHATTIGQRASRIGFTLIELMIVVVIIGILARIAIVKTRATKDKAMLAAVKADLHNLEIAQEAYFSDYRKYGTLAQLKKRTMYQLSPGNTMKLSTAAAGYTATATNKAIASSIKKCTVHIGTGGSTVDGTITCP